MKIHNFVCFFATLAGVLGRPDSYPTKYDDFDVNEVLGNRRLLKGYIECTLDAGPCTPEGAELKSHISEALENNCAKCSDRQREIVNQVVKHLINKESEFWQKLCDRYDPSKKYVTLYENQLREVQE